MDEERTHRIRERAHALWEQAGRPHGQDSDHWSQAEREIAAEDEASSSMQGKAGARRGRKPKAAPEEGAEVLKAAPGWASKSASEDAAAKSKAPRGRKPRTAAADDDEAPKARRGIKPKVVAEGSDAAE